MVIVREGPLYILFKVIKGWAVLRKIPFRFLLERHGVAIVDGGSALRFF